MKYFELAPFEVRLTADTIPAAGPPAAPTATGQPQKRTQSEDGKQATPVAASG